MVPEPVWRGQSRGIGLLMRDLADYLTMIALDVRDRLDRDGFSDVSFKIIALMNGEPITKVGVVGEDDPAHKEFIDD